MEEIEETLELCAKRLEENELVLKYVSNLLDELKSQLEGTRLGTRDLKQRCKVIKDKVKH